MGKTLILYFSVYGTTKKFAEEIGRQTSAELRAIKPAQAYDSNREHLNRPGFPGDIIV
jgi:flavodoxin